MADAEHDVVVVGASLAGCTAAILFAQAGARVALVESKTDAAAHKKLCTHYIHAIATPTLARIGLADEIEAAGGRANGVNMWTRAGWMVATGESESGERIHGYNIRRSTLDPMIRRLAGETPGVDLMMRHVFRDTLSDHGRTEGVTVEHDGRRHDLRAPLTVAADGRHSRVARAAAIDAEVSKNERFGFFAHFRDVKFTNPDAEAAASQMWLLEPAAALAFANDDGVTVLIYMGPLDELDDFAQDREAGLLGKFEGLPDAPDLSNARRVSEVRGSKADVDNIRRPVWSPGLALVGDAAISMDPLLGFGCGWAIKSAEWLVDSAGVAVVDRDRRRIDRQLRRYSREHGRNLGPPFRIVRQFSRARPLDSVTRRLLAAAAHDRALAERMHRFSEQYASPASMLHPSAAREFLRGTLRARAMSRTPA